MSLQQQIWTITRRAARWHVHSQETARRNAMVASTALTQRRVELDEVEEFLALHRRQFDVRAVQAGQPGQPGQPAGRTQPGPALRNVGS